MTCSFERESEGRFPSRLAGVPLAAGAMWTLDEVMWYCEPSAAAAAGLEEEFMAAGFVVAVVMTGPERLNGAGRAAAWWGRRPQKRTESRAENGPYKIRTTQSELSGR